MINTIVVPLDGSSLAESALVPARALAERLDAGLVLLTTHWADGTGDAQQYLDRVAAGLEALRVKTSVVHDRAAPEAILLQAEQPRHVVCMATHGRGGLAHVVLGSVAEAVLQKSRAPLLLVGPNLERGAWKSPEWFAGGHLVVALDGSEVSQAILSVAAQWARLLGLRLELVHVTVTTLGLGPGARPESADGARLDELAATITGVEEPPLCTTLRGPDVAASLLEHAGRAPSTLLALTSHGRTGLARVTLGSVAMRVVHRSPCPVLVYRSL
jgi:nucleotide-binding universal stress UspA family protein